MAEIISKVWTMDAIETAVRVRGSHWFDRDTMRFFGTRIIGEAVTGPGGVYFVTSEKPPHGPRRWSVRKFDPDTANISTFGPFCEMSRSAAIKACREAAEGGAS